MMGADPTKAELACLALLDPSTPDRWPQGILRVADLREQRATAATQGVWGFERTHDGNWTRVGPDPLRGNAAAHCMHDEDAEHIAAEANPAHTLAAVRRWRGVVERHTKTNLVYTDGSICDRCDGVTDWPCPDLTETAAEARAYLGGTS